MGLTETEVEAILGKELEYYEDDASTEQYPREIAKIVVGELTYWLIFGRNDKLLVGAECIDKTKIS